MSPVNEQRPRQPWRKLEPSSQGELKDTRPRPGPRPRNEQKSWGERIKGLVGISPNTRQTGRTPATFSVPRTHRLSFLCKNTQDHVT